MKRNKKIIFVHGYGFRVPLGENDWPHWLGREAKKNGFDFRILLMPDPIYPLVDEWLNFFQKQEIEVNEDTYFVGHSLGCITIARFLEKLSEGAIAGGCVFVSGFCTIPKIPLLKDFCDLPLDFMTVKKHAREFVVVISDNDRIIPRASSEELAKRLQARVVVEPNKGHFISGVTEIPSVLNSILEMDQAKEKLRQLL